MYFKPSKEWAEEVKEGCIKLLKVRYKENKYLACPFCPIKNKYSTVYDYIRPVTIPCPWVIFTGFSCTGINYKDFIVEKERDFRNRTNKQNINRLKGWIVDCDNIINRELNNIDQTRT